MDGGEVGSNTCSVTQVSKVTFSESLDIENESMLLGLTQEVRRKYLRILKPQQNAFFHGDRCSQSDKGGRGESFLPLHLGPPQPLVILFPSIKLQ